VSEGKLCSDQVENNKLGTLTFPLLACSTYHHLQCQRAKRGERCQSNATNDNPERRQNVQSRQRKQQRTINSATTYLGEGVHYATKQMKVLMKVKSEL
jgi:hypothetical protein